MYLLWEISQVILSVTFKKVFISQCKILKDTVSDPISFSGCTRGQFALSQEISKLISHDEKRGLRNFLALVFVLLSPSGGKPETLLPD